MVGIDARNCFYEKSGKIRTGYRRRCLLAQHDDLCGSAPGTVTEKYHLHTRHSRIFSHRQPSPPLQRILRDAERNRFRPLKRRTGRTRTTEKTGQGKIMRVTNQ